MGNRKREIKCGMRNGEWGKGNGEWENGEWGMGKLKWEIENWKLKIGN